MKIMSVAGARPITLREHGGASVFVANELSGLSAERQRSHDA